MLALLSFGFLALSGLNAHAATDDCASLLTDAIPIKWVEKMLSEGKANDPQSQRLRDIVQRLGFTSAALNQQIIRAHNEKYTTEIEQGPATNQKQSGRCWIFAGLNMLRSVLIAEGRVPNNFEFSENYLHFFNMLEKSNRYLEKIIERTSLKKSKASPLKADELENAYEPQIGDGGWFEYFMFLVSKYGLVPKNAMPETRSSESTAVLLSELKRHLAATARDIMHAKIASGTVDVESMRAVKEHGMVGIWRILATHLGDPPGTFDYRTERGARKEGLVVLRPTDVTTYSPRRFATEFVGFNAGDYVIVGSSPNKPMGAVYEKTKSAIGPTDPGRPAFNVRLLNLPIQRLEELTMAAIQGGQPVWFAADIGKDVDHATGIMHPQIYARDPLYGMEDQPKRLSRSQRTFYGISSPNHAMLLTGFDRPDLNAPVVKFKNENSWGDAHGTKGTYHLYREWFQQNVYEVIIHKKFLSDAERALWEGPAIMLEEKDHLF